MVNEDVIWHTNRLMIQPIPEEPVASATSSSTPSVTASAVTETVFIPRPPQPALPHEVGGREGLEPTRYGDWEKAGRCIDF